MLTNDHNMPLSVALWLAADEYDHNPSTDYISGTGILKPMQQIVLGKRIDPTVSVTDISSLVASRIGTGVHDGIERAWSDPKRRLAALRSLGIDDELSKQILINPDPSEVTADDIPIYMEQRVTKRIAGINVGGKYDFIAEGQLEDFKSTKVISYQLGGNIDNHIKQGSIYRWLNPDIVTEDTILISYILTDWTKGKALTDPNYPQCPVVGHKYPLMSIADTEAYLTGRIEEYLYLLDKPVEDMPPCSDEDLWRQKSQYKYYKNPEKATSGGRSTKNFDDMPTALIKLQDDGNVGVVIEKKGKLQRCKWCSAFSICKQKDQYIADGSLEV